MTEEKYAIAIEALERIAAEAFVSLCDLPHYDQPNGWRKIAVERIDIAYEALAAIEAINA